MRASAEWVPETIDMFTAVLGEGRDRRFCVVERLPDGEWDWVTWSSAGAGVPLQGQASSVLQAMHEAEAAAEKELASRGKVPYLSVMQASGWANAFQ